MSIISNFLKKSEELMDLTRSIKKLATDIEALTIAVTALAEAAKEQQILLAEIYVVQTYILKTLQLDMADISADLGGPHEVIDRKTQKPN